MNGWEVIKVGDRKIRGTDYRSEVVVILRSDDAGGVLELNDKLRVISRTRASRCPLTAIQLRALTGLAAGKTYKEIAADRGVSVSTVRSQLSATYKKLAVVDRAQAVLKAVGEGWI